MPKKRLSVIVTKTGDGGETSLIGGKRVSKASMRVEAYGTIDELNAFIGWARTEIKDSEIVSILRDIQRDLFTLGADIAAPLDVKVPRINSSHIKKLENLIEDYLKNQPPLKDFVIPGGSKENAVLHLLRVVSRRAERRVVAIPEGERNPYALVYLNRLSDLFFVLARFLHRKRGLEEDIVNFSKSK